MDYRTFTAISLAIVLMGCPQQPRPSQTSLATTTIKLEGTGFTIVAPEVFEVRAEKLYFPEFDAILAVHVVTKSFDEFSATYNEESLQALDMVMDSKEYVRVNGVDGTLFHYSTDRTGKPKQGWVALFPHVHGTVQLTTIYPKAMAQKASPAMRKALLSVEHE